MKFISSWVSTLLKTRKSSILKLPKLVAAPALLAIVKTAVAAVMVQEVSSTPCWEAFR